MLSIPTDPNNILAHAVAGIPLDSEACAPNGSATESAVEIGIPSSAPTQTVTLEVREEFHWRGWNHGPHRERVTFTRSLGDSVVSITSKASGKSYLSSFACIADHGTFSSSCDDLADHFEQRDNPNIKSECECWSSVFTPSTSCKLLCHEHFVKSFRRELPVVCTVCTIRVLYGDIENLSLEYGIYLALHSWQRYHCHIERQQGVPGHLQH